MSERWSDILVTHPGMYGDVLWATATMKAISGVYQTPVDVLISKEFGTEGFLSLLRAQEWCAGAREGQDWIIRATAPLSPREPPITPGGYKRVFHLGLSEWPLYPIPLQIYYGAMASGGVGDLPDLSTPWLTVPWSSAKTADVVIGFNNHWIELKMGVAGAVTAAFQDEEVSFSILSWEGSRVGEWGVPWMKLDWVQMAQTISKAKVFLGCLSAPWVLANGLGIPTVIFEPAEARHNPIFWLDLPRNHMVRGGDEKPTFDSREVTKVLREVLEGQTGERFVTLGEA